MQPYHQDRGHPGRTLRAGRPRSPGVHHSWRNDAACAQGLSSPGFAKGAQPRLPWLHTARHVYGGHEQLAEELSGSNNTRHGYTGEEYDAETGLLYLRARYYDPQLGRFISVDPFLGRMAEPATQNRYVYVMNNPVLFTDPTGLDVMATTYRSADWLKFWDSVGAATASAAQFAFGFGEISLGTVGMAAPTIITQVGGAAAVAHGSYNVSAGGSDFLTNSYNAYQALQPAESRGAYAMDSLTTAVMQGVYGDSSVVRNSAKAGENLNGLVSGRITTTLTLPSTLQKASDMATIYNAERSVMDSVGQISASPYSCPVR